MSKFYLTAQPWGNNILYRGFENGQHITEKVPFQPTLYITGKNANSGWRGLYDNEHLDPVEFDSIKDAKNFIETYKDVQGIQVHGFQKFQYQFIQKNFSGDIDYDLSKVNILTYDLEVINPDFESGFPDILSADTPIVTCALHSSLDGKNIVYGFKEYKKQPEDNFEYVLFDSEKEMLKGIVLYFQTTRPHVITGWNTETFDTPYLINRIMRVLDETWVKKLSPFGIVNERLTKINGQEIQSYDIMGIIELDMMILYRKYGTYSAKESYALGFIAQEELGETKVELPGTSFRDNYINYHSLFIKYNSVDVDLVQKLERKMKLIELAFGMAFMYKCNVQDIFRTVAPWEVFIFNHLAKNKIAVPPRRSGMRGDFEGAWVMDPVKGMHGWVMSFDFASLYPSIMRQWNISPETFRSSEVELRVQDWLDLNDRCYAAVDIAKSYNCTVAANGTMYSKDKQGFLPALMEYCMEGRKLAKKEMLKLESEYQKTKDESLVPRISALNNRQMALKIAANSVYGAIGNEGFHYFDYRMAEAITLTGQLSDIHLGNSLSDKFNKILKNAVDENYVIYGDTDSLYMNCQSIVDKFVGDKSINEITNFLDKFADQVCQPVINKSVDSIYDLMNCNNKVMASKREAIASKCLFRGKKNYALYLHDSEGVKYDPPKLKAIGIQIVRSDTPQWCRKKLKECLMMIFEKDEESLQKRFVELEAEFKTLPADEIGKPSGISDIDKHFDGKKIRHTGTIPGHVRSAINYNIAASGIESLQQIGNGAKIKYVYLKLPNPIKQKSIGFPSHMKLPKEFNLEKFIDYDLQFSKTFKIALTSLTEPAGWKLEVESSLEDFFG